MNRGRRREKVFLDSSDYQAFVDLLANVSDMFKAQVAAFALMSNHYHVLLCTPEGNINRIMRHVGGVYTQDFNRRHGHDGQLFRGRYKAILVDDEEYLSGLVRYIHHNPLKAGLAASLDEYAWTSQHAYLADSGIWSWMHRAPLLKRFSDDLDEARKGYFRFMAEEDDERVEQAFSMRNLPSILGGLDFVKRIKERFITKKLHREVPAARVLAPSVQEIMAAVVACYGVDEAPLFLSRRGVTNEPRDMAIHLIRMLCGTLFRRSPTVSPSAATARSAPS
jgi:REP element-mobilizing transposase RayT